MIKNYLLILLIVASSAFATDTKYLETRYCGAPTRDSTGTIVRSQSVLRHFKEQHPCPVTGKEDGQCAGWSVNHVIPLACGGCDTVSNMQWLPNSIKTCSGDNCVDRFERKINASNPPQPDTANCKNVIVK
jgi:hypothetical protein